MDSEITRRQILAYLASTGTVGIAGCGRLDDQTSGDSTDSTQPTKNVLVVEASDEYIIPAGETETYRRAIINGELSVEGTLVLTGD